MKKIFSLLFLVVIFAFGGCEKTDNNEVIPSIPSVEIETDDNENERKKYYAVSTVNGLRLRSSPTTSSSTVGYLDKNDAVIYIEKQGEEYFIKLGQGNSGTLKATFRAVDMIGWLFMGTTNENIHTVG